MEFFKTERKKKKAHTWRKQIGPEAGAGGFGKLGERSQKLQTSSCKSWGCNVLHGDSSNTVLHM